MLKQQRTNSSLRIFLLLFALCHSSSRGYTQIRILFDATKGEMAGNADWVIDADQTNIGVGSGGPYITTSGNKSNPQHIPTPAQGTITTSTPDTYWTGGLSSWAIDCVNQGYTVETLPWNGHITYGDVSNTQDLSRYKVFVIDEPNLVFSSSEKTALIQFVQNGGGMFMIANHSGSDRNGDGWDSPEIWNDFFSNNPIHLNPFGIQFDLADFSQTTTNVSAATSDSIIHGPYGHVTRAEWASGNTMTLNPAQNSTVKGVIFKTGTTPGNTNAMVAYARYGNGKVAAIGDSSPTDDGTGNPDCTLYDGYWADASGNHRLLLMNIIIWLAQTNASVGVNTLTEGKQVASFYPNPTNGNVHINLPFSLKNVTITVYDMLGSTVWNNSIPGINNQYNFSLRLSPGQYIVKLESDDFTQTTRVIIH